MMGTFSLHRYDTAVEFSQDAYDFLAEDEAAHNIFFGVTDDVIRYPRRFPGDNLFATVVGDGEVRMALMQTPPHMLVLSRALEAECVTWAAATLAESDREIPGILSAPDQAHPFIDAYVAETGRQMELASRQRIYRATHVEDPADVDGAFRRAEHGDLERLIDWIVSFEQEVFDREDDALRDEVANKVSDFVRADAVGVWVVDGDVVSMAAARGPTPRGIRISYVYTPPEQRRHGYASACTAHLTRSEFEAGRDFCFLFTDLDNPTSNHIYQEIGYEPVSDMNIYEVVE